MIIKNPGFKMGYNSITNFNDLPWYDKFNTKMNFGILLLAKNDCYNFNEPLEKAILLMTGTVELVWSLNHDNNNISFNKIVSRTSIWHENPWCLHLPKSYNVNIKSLSEKSELALISTLNEKDFLPKLYGPNDCQTEERGKGILQETSTRLVRTIFDDSNAPLSNLVLGEVINLPGKWSSYPPHKHEMPELYHYRFLPEQGFGFSMLEEDTVQVHNGDTVLIFNQWHSQTSAPGYAMYYIWSIRHLDNKRYGPKSNTPYFDPKHEWTMNKDNQDKIFNLKL